MWISVKEWVIVQYLKLKLIWLFKEPLTPWDTNMAHCEFEAVLKWDCVKSVIEIVRTGKAGNGEVAKAIEHACCFGGCAAKLYTTLTPAPAPDFFSATAKGSIEDSLESLCKALEDACPDGNCDAQGKPLTAEAIDWANIFNSILPLLWSLIQKLIDGVKV